MQPSFEVLRGGAFYGWVLDATRYELVRPYLEAVANPITADEPGDLYLVGADDLPEEMCYLLGQPRAHWAAGRISVDAFLRDEGSEDADAAGTDSTSTGTDTASTDSE